MKKKISILLTFLLFFTLVGCGNNKAAEKSGDNKDLKLTVYVGLEESHGALAIKKFEEATGIKTNFVRMSGGEIYARIKAEKDNETASVWYGGGVDTFIDADKNGYLEHYISPAAKDFAKNFKDPDGAWTGIYSGYLGFEADQKWLDEKGIEMPKTWDDLLKPVFKDNIVVAHPGSSSTAYTYLATVLQLKGEEEGWKYLQKFSENVRQYTKSGSAGGRMVSLGEAGISVGFLHDAIKFKKEGYKDLVYTAPEDGTGYEIGAVGIIKGGPDQEAAKKFVDWCLSTEAQELGQTVGSFQFLTNPKANPPKEAEELKNTKLIDYDFEWAGKNRSQYIEKFTELTKTTIPKK